ncbi:MAG: hypothetical protein B7O98_05195 [Zestosphaera tikiterensis]|uniref:non-specific serine/threonine protein kinase n=1 Tax=Zestosphaera tikiterensis TaxID=1973259 RepID=A0A2R7Y5S9_9CREN|nr:MAG: hypothetical protein B7O98_05195 [Zestosphaera tikiterensis]
MELALIYRELSEVEFKVLKALNSLLTRYEYVPLEELEGRVKLPSTHILKALYKLTEFKAVVKHPTMPWFRITYVGLDLTALKKLSEAGVITHLGTRVGVGKESEVYIAKAGNDEIVAVKFYKIGRVSFQKVRRVRHYTIDQTNWMLMSKTAAEREFKILNALNGKTPYVPKAYGMAEHAVVINYIPGVELIRYRDAREPLEILKKILSAVRCAYLCVGVVHGDLSEYNIIVSSTDEVETPYIIDWPQYVYVADPQHEPLLLRDVEYVIKFFKRRYGVYIDVSKALRYVRGLSDEL